MVDNYNFNKEWILENIISVLKDDSKLKAMSKSSFSLAKPNATKRLAEIVDKFSKLPHSTKKSNKK